TRNTGASVFTYEVADPTGFGVLMMDGNGRPSSIVEKPDRPLSKLAVTGLYLYDCEAIDIALRLTPSPRGEFEITDVNNAYLRQGRLTAYPLGRGFAWLDGGSARSLFEASQFIQMIEVRTGLKIGCPEEVAYRLRFIDRAALRALLETMPMSDYRKYLADIESQP